MMKKFFVFPIMAVLLLSGCGKEIEVENVEPTGVDPVLTPIIFRSTASDEGTKVTIDGFNLKFSVEENIAVASYNFASETTPICCDYATLDGEAVSASGTFTPHTSVYGSSWAGEASAVSFYSYYPVSAAAPSISGTTATVTNIATSQDGSVNNIVCWAKGAQVASAAEVTEGNAPSFAFSPVCALMKLKIVNNDDTYATSLSSIGLTASSGNSIAGSASLNLLTGALSGGSASSVSYTPASTLAIAKSGGSTTIYLSFIPAVVEYLKVSFNDTRSGYCYSATIDKAWPESFLPGRMYERTITITDIAPTSVTGSLGLFNGVKFARGLLKRTDTSTTSSDNMRFSDATDNPLEILNYTNEAASVDSYYMYFSWNELNTIFGGKSGTSFESNTITIGGHQYKVPSSANLSNLLSTTRSSNAPSINSTEKAWSCVKVTLTDSYLAIGTNYSGKGFETNNTASDYIRGLLFFPDGASVTCGCIDASKCDVFSAEIFGNPSTITTSQLQCLVDGGCLFLPSAGGHSNVPAWNSRGSNGYYWSSTYNGGRLIQVIEGTSLYTISQGTYSGTRHFPVVLVQAD